MSVNLSALQFEDPDLVTTVQGALEEAGLPSRCLILELTESAVLRRADSAVDRLAALKALGIQIALDDFGTGQSSLSLLRSLPFDVLKIDRSFLQAERQDDRGSTRMLIGVMVTLAHGLDMHVTAGGVETPEQLALVRELGCDQIQGFMLSHPGPLDSLG